MYLPAKYMNGLEERNHSLSYRTYLGECPSNQNKLNFDLQKQLLFCISKLGNTDRNCLNTALCDTSLNEFVINFLK